MKGSKKMKAGNAVKITLAATAAAFGLAACHNPIASVGNTSTPGHVVQQPAQNQGGGGEVEDGGGGG